MAKKQALNVDLLTPYFKSQHYKDDVYCVDVEILSAFDEIAFEVSLECKEPSTKGAFPQRRFAMERHSDKGHEGVHLQINYHLIENEMGIGRLYIVMDIKDEMELLRVAEGFIYLLYEILVEMGPALERIAGEMFDMKRLPRIKDRKSVIIAKVHDSLRDQKVTIRSVHRKEVIVYKGQQLLGLLSERRELTPLLGPLARLD